MLVTCRCECLEVMLGVPATSASYNWTVVVNRTLTTTVEATELREREISLYVDVFLYACSQHDWISTKRKFNHAPRAPPIVQY